MRLSPSPEHLETVVEDEGPGIPEEQRERVFAPFVRLESSCHRATGGVGLGLSIARKIARSHGGDILVTKRESVAPRASLRRSKE